MNFEFIHIVHKDSYSGRRGREKEMSMRPSRLEMFNSRLLRNKALRIPQSFQDIHLPSAIVPLLTNEPPLL